MAEDSTGKNTPAVVHTVMLATNYVVPRTVGTVEKEEV